MSYKSYKSNNLAEFIRDFNFPNPSWDRLPAGFPDCDGRGLSEKQDRHLFEAIKTAWIIEGGGRKTFYKTAVRKAAFGIAVVIVIVLLGKTITESPEKTITRSANAKTITQTVGEIIESTRSAILKIK